MEQKLFTSIESFRHVMAHVRKYYGDLALPTIKYRGRPKIHGSNAGIRFNTDNTITAVSRSRDLSLQVDMAGLAMFVANKSMYVIDMFDKIGMKGTLFGEWAGSNIQKGVAVAQLPKHFVAFSFHDGENYVDISQIFSTIPQDMLKTLNENNIFFIDQVSPIEVDIPFHDPQSVVDYMSDLTLAAEHKCPWGEFRGVIGVGEGYVWTPEDPAMYPNTSLWFKTKGLKHKNEGKEGVKKQSIGIDPERVKTIAALIPVILPQWRLEQGLTETAAKHSLESSSLLTTTHTGDFIDWIMRDILKEENDVIVANGMEWKALSGSIAKAAREYFFSIVK